MTSEEMIKEYTTEELIDELKTRAEAYSYERTALGSPGIEFWFLTTEWNHNES